LLYGITLGQKAAFEQMARGTDPEKHPPSSTPKSSSFPQRDRRRAQTGRSQPDVRDSPGRQPRDLTEILCAEFRQNCCAATI
jgi:hypothetical protein